MLKKKLMISLLTSLVTVACLRVRANVDPTLSSGPLKFLDTALIHVPPKGIIHVCGEGASIVVESIKIWAQAINRADSLVIEPGCSDLADRKITIHSQSSEVAKKGCSQVSKSGVNNHVEGYVMMNTLDYVLCVSPTMVGYAAIALHEAGHLWGMCDDYDSKKPGCDVRHNVDNESDIYGTMGNLRKVPTLHMSNIAAIRRLAERSDIPANKLWKDFLREARTDVIISYAKNYECVCGEFIDSMRPTVKTCTIYVMSEDEEIALGSFLDIGSQEVKQNVDCMASCKLMAADNPGTCRKLSSISSDSVPLEDKDEQGNLLP